MDPKLKEVVEMLTSFNPADYAVREGGKEVAIYLVDGSKKGIILKDDGSWEYK